jgi:hypothetical protein
MSASDWTDTGTEWSAAAAVLVAGVDVVACEVGAMELTTVDVKVGEPVVDVDADLVVLLTQPAEITATTINAPALSRWAVIWLPAIAWIFFHHTPPRENRWSG